VNELLNIFSADILQHIISNKNLKLCQLNSIINLLVKLEKQFTLTFTPETPVAMASALLVIEMRPNISVSITISLDSGAILL